jgi:predicted PurR-regulated permease PerM
MTTVERRSMAAFARRVLVATAIVVLALLIWRVAGALVLAFAAVLLAILLRMIAEPLLDYTRLPEGWAITFVAIPLATLLCAIVWLAGSEISAQVYDVTQMLPQALRQLQERISDSRLAERLIAQASGGVPSAGSILFGITGVATSTIGALANVVLVLFGALYLALQPRVYREGLVQLIPPGSQVRVDETLDACGRALRFWLLGQLLAMALVGTLTTVGLWLAGVPGYLALGILAGLAEFVPFIGPIFAAVPALLLALMQDAETLFWTAVVYMTMQQLESNVINPVIVREMLALPPALTLFAIAAFGLIFGLPGMLLATPLTVIAFVAVKRLWIREALNEETTVPGETDSRRGLRRS